MLRLSGVVGLSMLGVLLMAYPAQATLYGFYGITNTSETNTDIGEAQLFVDVLNGNGQARFRFWNVGLSTCSITDVYFDDGTLLTLDSIVDADEGGGHSGVDFSVNASPGNLPSGGEPGIDFYADEGFTADSDSPPPAWGVQNSDPGDEWLEIQFSLNADGTLQDVLDELSDGSLRIGIHVQAFDAGGSESFINNPYPVPEPGSISLLALGGLGLLRTRRRRREALRATRGR